MFELFLLTKIIISVTVVIILSVIAEHVSPKVAGLLSGYPLGAAIVLFFYGLEIDTQFASNSALYTMIGLVASQFFVYLYFKSSSCIERFSIVISSIISITGYLVVAWLLHFIKLNKFFAILTPIFSISLFWYLFREIKDENIRNMKKLSYKVLIIRGLFAALIILVITRSGKLLGSTWAGLFSAFPVTLFPLMLIVHFTYDIKHVHTIIKNFPRGLGSLIVYSLTVSLTYPPCGIYVGTVISFFMATAYLFIYGFVFMKREKIGR